MIYWQLYWLFFRMSLVAFGGMFGILPEIQRLVVDEHHWLTADQFIQSYVVGQFVPGPNMAMTGLIGYRVAGIPGAMAATLGVYTGPVLIIAIVTTAYYRNRNRGWVRRCELALRPLVFGLIAYSAVVFLYQQMGHEWLKGLAIGVPFAWLNWQKRLGALPAIIGVGVVWWLLRGWA